MRKFNIRTTLLLFLLISLAFQSYSQKIIKTYYDLYNLKLKEEYQVDKNGFMNGYYKSFFQNKMQSEVGLYKNDLKTGVWKTFDRTGKLKQEANFKDDQLHGITKVWENGNGFHYLKWVKYFEMGINNEVRTIEYYDGGRGVKSDIQKNGECKYLYLNGKPAKIWQNQNFNPIASSVKIWDQDGKAFVLQKTVKGINFIKNADVEFDYAGRNSGQPGYYITAPTKVVGDSAGWKIDISTSLVYINKDDEIEVSWGTNLKTPKPYGSAVIKREKADTSLVSTYIINPYGADGVMDPVIQDDDFWLDLKFLDYPKTFLQERTVRIVDPKRLSLIYTTVKTTYNEKGEIVKKQTGYSEPRDGQIRFVAETQSKVSRKSFGLLSISMYDEDNYKIFKGGSIKGSIENSNYTFEYDKAKNLLVLLKDSIRYLSASISLLNVIQESLKYSNKGTPIIADGDLLGKTLDLLDNSPQSFFYYASDLQLHNKSGEIVSTLKSAASYYDFGLGRSPTLKSYVSGTNTLHLNIKPDNKEIIDQSKLLEFITSKISFDVKQTKGLLRNRNVDLAQELQNFANSFKE